MRPFILSLLCLTAITTSTATAHDFSWDTMVRAAIKFDPDFDYEANVDSWMQVYRKDVWKRYREDEFAMEEKRTQTIEMMKRSVEQFDLSEEMTLQTRFQLGKYDVKKLAFPVKSLSNTNYWYTNSRSGSGSLPYRFSIYLSNPEMLQWVPMPKDQARTFVKMRVDRYGNVDRYVSATVRVKLKRPKSRPGEFLVEVQSARFYHDKGRTRIVHEFRKPKPTAKIKPQSDKAKEEKTEVTQSAR